MLRTIAKALKALRPTAEPAPHTKNQNWTVVLDWSTDEYSHLEPLTLHVQAPTPGSALIAAFLEAGHTRAVSQFEALEGDDLTEAAMGQLHCAVIFPGTHHPANS